MTDDYVLADDLSGALEAGAAFRARGRRVVLQLEGSEPAGDRTLVLHSSETRNLRGAAAAERVRQMLVRQRTAGANLLLKKIDSTLRGPVGEEIKVVLDELAPPLVVVCPASPAVGRTVCEGRLLVHGVPVADTEFRRDPGWPVTESRIEAVLAAGGIEAVTPLPLSRLRSAGTLEPGDCRGVLVSDAETDADLERLVALVRRQEPRAIFVGAGGLAHALAAAAAGADYGAPPPHIEPRSILFVSGSMRTESRRQLEFLRNVHHIPLIEISLATGAEETSTALVVRHLSQFGCASLTIAANARPADHSEPVTKLAGAIRLLARAGKIPEMLAVTGGETAQALCAALGIQQLYLVGEVGRGVVISTPIGRGSFLPKHLAIKPGGFGSVEIWVELFRANRDINMK